MLSILSIKPPMAGRSTLATTSGTWPWKDGTKSSWRCYPLLLINNPGPMPSLPPEALLVDFLGISYSSSFQTLKLYANKLNCCFLPCAAQFKLSNIEKKPSLCC